MSGSNFDIITQELLRQKQTMDQLEEENQELRRQLTELRDGRGIFVVIDGQRFALMSDSNGTSHTLTSAIEPTYDMPTIPDMSEAEVEPVASEPDIAHEQTEELAVNAVEVEQLDRDVTPEVATIAAVAQVSEQNTEPTFLEEAMIEEFAAAATSPLAVWPNIKQEQQKSSETGANDELALLRRQLIGSYLLE